MRRHSSSATVAVEALGGSTTLPPGVGTPVVVAEEPLERADQVVFFAGGVVEARSAGGEFSGRRAFD